MEESHAKLRDRPCLEDRPSAARGLYLQGSACCSEARVLFKCFPFGECGNPATLVVWRFQHPDIAVFHPSENNAALTAKDPTAAGSTAGSTSANSMAANSTATGSTDASLPAASPGEWWVNFSTLGMLLSSCVCLACICFAEYESHM